ncbi:aromatic acid exporter family protein [Candidatus Stoquefichus massiliensis]|uniref:aromatic acid exporter family protein n=1 Tax=Candidatus Stoquefichus massiliensis TaxID=1470350 RepID=UPI0004AE9008|nr:aromatic acid exporter family protein [Candidatus Stoquefichus massiliensis]
MNGLKMIKMSLAFLIAMSIAQVSSFQYAASAGIVAILTIQNTKKETLLICLKRILSFFVSLLSALAVFSLMGYSALSFSIFLLFFIGFSFLFHLEDGIAMNAVITTHYLIEESMSLHWIQNEMAIFMIGITVGILINLYMPSRQQQIRQSLKSLDDNMKEILIRMSDCLMKEKKTGLLYQTFDEVLMKIDEMLSQAYEQMNNQLLNDTKYEVDYLLMRKRQLFVLKDIYDLMIQIEFNGKQVLLISQYFKEMAKEYHEDNNVSYLRQCFDHLKEQFQHDELPKTRHEFENRAILYTMFTYLQKFLHLKQEFYHNNKLEKTSR